MYQKAQQQDASQQSEDEETDSEIECLDYDDLIDKRRILKQAQKYLKNRDDELKKRFEGRK